MVIENITQEDLLNEVADWIRQNSNARPGPEWFTPGELQALLPEFSTDRIRRILDRGVKNGLYEKIRFGRSIVYYRKKG